MAHYLLLTTYCLSIIFPLANFQISLDAYGMTNILVMAHYLLLITHCLFIISPLANFQISLDAYGMTNIL
ncbi:hypothetical protein, partial [Elizabethkingia meningoseptica]|uniref:hypothetical protein n=1 Tax=Elizabethkingia meningoseptica TaxID=238 RepID=UPI002DD6A492